MQIIVLLCWLQYTAVKKKMQHFYCIAYNKKLYVFILIDNMFSKKELYNLISMNDNIIK